jgi:hypothetical protein
MHSEPLAAVKHQIRSIQESRRQRHRHRQTTRSEQFCLENVLIFVARDQGSMMYNKPGEGVQHYEYHNP